MANVLVTMNAFSEKALSSYPELFPAISRAGFDGVEIRRELLTKETPKLAEIKTLLTELELIPYYSCPVSLFGADHQLVDLTLYYKEATELGAALVKFSLGNYQDGISKMHPLADALRYFTEAGIRFTIENDQTAAGGKLSRLQSFFAKCRSADIPVYLTCDIGNWQYTGEDPERAAAALKDQVVYVHIKEVIETEAGYATIPIGRFGRQKWKRLLKLLPNDTAFALEFPVQSEMEDYLDMLKEEVYVK